MNDRNSLEKSKPTSMFRLKSVDDAFRLADIVAKSSLCPKDYRGRTGDIVVAWQLGAEVGLEPMQALAGIAVINGRPSLWGDTFLAVAMNHPAFVSIQEMSFSEIKIKQEATCIVVRKNREPVHRTFSVADARQAQLWGKAGPWKQYPERMLQMRARGFAIRDVFPDALIGMISAEEAHDYQPLERQLDGTLELKELKEGTHKFGFSAKPTQEPAPEHPADSSTYLGLIDMISAATDEDSLAACQPNGTIGAEERARAQQAWVSRMGEIREEKKREDVRAAGALSVPKTRPSSAATSQAVDELQQGWMDSDKGVEARPEPRPPEEPKPEEEEPWVRHLAKDSDTEVVDAVLEEGEEEKPYDAARDAAEVMK